MPPSADHAAAPPAAAGAAGRGAAAHGAPRAVLDLRHAVAIIVGVVIGAGIFKAPSLVAGMAGSAPWMFVLWLAGGLVSLAGALCYAELATAYPNAGGDYHFLHRAYGRSVSFLYAWARFSVITAGSIALLAFVFGDYLQQVLPLGPWGPSLYAGAAVVVLTAVNLRGIRAGAATQGWLTALEVGGLLAIVVAGLWLLAGGGDDVTREAVESGVAPARPALGALGMAMVFVLLTYGGWNEAAYISAELKESRRNMLRALLLSIAAITALYLVVVWAYWQGLGLDGMAQSDAVAADLLQNAFGPAGATAIAALVAVASLTSINATMIVGARTNFAVGCDWPALARLAHWDEARGTPTRGVWLQGLMSLALVGIGTWAGGGFKAMVEFTAPVFWLFFLLAGASLIVLRAREPQAERPFRVPLYPLLPLAFCAVCAGMLWSSLSYVYSQQLGGFNAAWIGVAVLAVGAVLLAALHAVPSTPSAAIDSPRGAP